MNAPAPFPPSKTTGERADLVICIFSFVRVWALAKMADRTKWHESIFLHFG